MGLPAFNIDNDNIKHYLNLFAIHTLGNNSFSVPDVIDHSILNNLLKNEKEISLHDFSKKNNVKVINNHPSYDCIIISPYDTDIAGIFTGKKAKSSSRQLRAARALLGININEVSKLSNVEEKIIKKLESNGFIYPNDKEEYINQVNVLKFYISKGVVFFPPNEVKKQGEAIALNKSSNYKFNIDEILPKKKVNENVKEILGLVKKTVGNKKASYVDNSINFNITNFHLKLAYALLDQDLKDFHKHDLHKSTQDINSVDSQLLEKITSDIAKKGVCLIPASISGTKVLHGEGVYVVNNDLVDNVRLLKAIECASKVCSLSIKELAIRSKINKDIADIWSYQIIHKLEKYNYLLSFLNSDDIYRIMEFLKQKGISIFYNYRGKNVIGMLYKSPKSMYPINISDEDSNWSIDKEMLKSLFQKTSVSIDNKMSLMDSSMLKSSLKLLKLDIFDIEYNEVFSNLIDKKIVNLNNKDINYWSINNTDQWSKIQQKIVDSGILFIKDKSKKGVVLEHASFEWMQTKLSNGLINSLQLHAAQELLEISDIDLAFKCNVEVEELQKIKKIKTGISISSEKIKRVINFFIENNIIFITPNNEHGEGVVLNGIFNDVSNSIFIHRKEKKYSASISLNGVNEQELSISDDELDKRINGNKVYNFPTKINASETNTTDEGVEKIIHGKVFFISRKISGVSKQDLMNKFGHKYYFLKNIESFDHVDISKKNMRDMFAYFSEKIKGLDVLESNNDLGSVYIPKTSMSYDELVYNLVEIFQEGVTKEISEANIKSKDFNQFKDNIYQNVLKNENIVLSSDVFGYKISVKGL